MSILRVESLTKSFGGVRAVNDLSLAVDCGRVLGITGPNGSGKTTVFNLITGFMSKDLGKVVLSGKDISNMPTHRIASLGLVRTFQQSHMFGGLSVIENVLTGMRHVQGEKVWRVWLRHRAVGKESDELRGAAADLLSRVGITFEHDHPSNTLSYGQQKLLELVRALAAKPKVLLLDEPTAGADPSTISKIGEIVRWQAREGIAVIIIEHNISFIKQVSDEVIVMDRGRQVACGSPEDVTNRKEVVDIYLGGGVSEPEPTPTMV